MTPGRMLVLWYVVAALMMALGHRGRAGVDRGRPQLLRLRMTSALNGRGHGAV
jgi:hypothetical protein